MNNEIIPFTPENFICDTSLHLDDIVEQTTSWLTINPMIGCSLSCAYCFREKWGAPDVPYLKTSVENCLEELENHPLFVPNITPLSVNVSSTDALLPKVKETTFRIINSLDKKGYKNIFGIISKLELKKKDLLFLKSIKNLRIVFLISYAEIPFEIEPVPVKPRINNLKKLKNIGIPTILYFRPIVEGWNDDFDKILKVLSLGNEFASAVSIGGLRVSPEIRNSLLKRNINIPNYEDNYHPKELSFNLISKILEIYNESNLNIPLFKHTSCAVSYIFKQSNYNALYNNPVKNCLKTCPKQQQNLCGIKNLI